MAVALSFDFRLLEQLAQSTVHFLLVAASEARADLLLGLWHVETVLERPTQLVSESSYFQKLMDHVPQPSEELLVMGFGRTRHLAPVLALK